MDGQIKTEQKLLSNYDNVKLAQWSAVYFHQILSGVNILLLNRLLNLQDGY